MVGLIARIVGGAVLALGVGVGLPATAQRLFRRAPWGALSETQQQRYKRWLRQHRRKLWGRDFDDGDGSIIDDLFRAANRTGDRNLVSMALKIVQTEADDEKARAAIRALLKEAGARDA